MRKPTTLQLALLFSLGLHAGLLALRIADPEGFQRLFKDTPLEVVLVNAKSQEPPAKAQALAQANLAGGGELDQGRATSPLPPSPQLEVGDSIELQQARIQQLQQVQQQLLSTVRRELALLPVPNPIQEQRSQEGRALAEKRRQLLNLLAEIEKRVNEENARPRKRYVSPATREAVYAIYYDALRRRIEDRGTRDFPSHQGRKLYGELIMNIHVDFKGRVLETELIQSSGQPMLDQRAAAIVRAAGPFGNFSKPMRQHAEVLVVTSRFKFTRDDGLEASISAQP